MLDSAFYEIPAEMREKRSWVCVKDGSKIPFTTSGVPASSTNPATWSGFHEVKAKVEEGAFDGIGFCFGGCGIIGIDIDDGFDADGFITEKAARIIDRVHSYTEVSRSGRGFHIYVKGQLPFGGRNNGSATEIYQTGRYFIVTGRQMFYDQLVENQSAVDWVVEKYFPEMLNRATAYNRKRAERIYAPTFRSMDFDRITLQPEYPDIQKGGRNISMLSLGCSLMRAGMTYEAMTDEVRRVNQRSCKPPLSEGELRSIIRQVNKYR